jgi:hypothetical protein
MGIWNDPETEDFAREVEEIEKNGGGYAHKEVPFGQYEVKVIKLTPAKSKSDKDMVTIWFKVLNGEHKGGMIFMNQVLSVGYLAHKVNEVLRGLTQDVPDIKIEYLNRPQYESLIMDVFEAIDGKYEYALEYCEDSKGYSTFKIKEVFVLE